MTYLLLNCCCQLLERRLMQVLVAGKTGIIPSAFVFLPRVPSSSRLCVVLCFIFLCVFRVLSLPFSLSFSLFSLFFFCSIFPNDLLSRFLLLASSQGFFFLSPFSCAYPEICIYSERVSSRMRNKVSIKLIFFFEV